MNRAQIVAGLLVAVVVAGGLGAVVATDFDAVDVEPVSENETTSGNASDGESESASGTDVGEFPTRESERADEPFAFRVEEIENCGETCREVTATVENTQSESASGVTVATTIYAGENSTEERVWENTEEIGTLAAGETDTSTERVDLSLMEAYAIEGNDGWITIETTVESDEKTVTLRETRQVA